MISPEELGQLGILQEMDSRDLNNVFPREVDNNNNNNNNNNANRNDDWNQRWEQLVALQNQIGAQINIADLLEYNDNDNNNNNNNNNNNVGQRDEENNQCTICLEGFQVGDVRRALPCMHTFHQNCVDRWLNIHRSCPICRTEIDNN